MAEHLVDFVNQMDRCWIERRFDDLAAYLDENVVLVAPSGAHRMTGRAAAAESYAEFMARSVLHRFETLGHRVTDRATTAVIEYDWDMAWRDGGTEHEATGREVLVLHRNGDDG